MKRIGLLSIVLLFSLAALTSVYAYRAGKPVPITKFDEQSLIELNQTLEEIWNILNGRIEEVLKLNIGNVSGDNYLEVENDGTIELHGTATTWDDLRVPSNAIRLPGAGAPTATPYKSGSVLSFAANALNTAYFNVQMPHEWKEGSDITPHLHWTVPDDNSGDVEWELTYSWANIGSDFPAATSDAKIVSVTSDQDEHLMSSFTAVSGTGKTLSSILICSVFRDGQAGNGDDTYGSAAYLVDIDFHYEIDSLGSRAILTK